METKISEKVKSTDQWNPQRLLHLLFDTGLLWDFSVIRNRNIWEGLINWSMKPLEDFCASFLTWLKRKLQRPTRKKRHFSCRAGVKDHLQSLHDIESSSPKTKLNQSELCTTYLSWWNLFVQVKVHIFWEGHIILRILPLTFDCMYCGQK